MFPIPFNFPFRKANGDISTIGAEINAGGGGSSYTLPTASANTKGGVKIGSGLIMDGEVLKNTNPTSYTLPTASDDTLGGVKVGSGLSINENGVLSTSGGGGGGGGVSVTDFTGSSLANGSNMMLVDNEKPTTNSILINVMIDNDRGTSYINAVGIAYDSAGKTYIYDKQSTSLPARSYKLVWFNP